MTEYLNIHQEIDFYTRAFDTGERKDKNMAQTIIGLREILSTGQKLFEKDKRILNILAHLIQEDINHIFIVSQIFAFHSPKTLDKPNRGIFGIKKIDTFDGVDGLIVLNYIRRKVSHTIKYNSITNDPRTCPIIIFESCLEINKYLGKARIVL